MNNKINISTDKIYSNSSKLTVSIGIPAFNEEDNLEKLLFQINEQNSDNYILSNIFVASDGSTDNTVDQLSKMSIPKLCIINGKKRIGKPKRINQIFAKSNSSVVIILDADIRLSNKKVLLNLVKPFYKDKNTLLTSGVAKPFKPNSIVEKIVNNGLLIWDEVKSLTPNNEMYYCEGPIRAFRKKLYKEIKFPDYSADDVFPYLYCAKRQYGFKSVKTSVVYYKLVDSLWDYVLQNKRYLRSVKIQEKNFGSNVVTNYFTVKTKTKFYVLSKYFFHNLLYTSIYLTVILLSRMLMLFDNDGTDSKWKILKSTKEIK